MSDQEIGVRREKSAVFLFLRQYALILVPEVFLEIFCRERDSERRGERENPLVTLASNLTQERPLGPG